MCRVKRMELSAETCDLLEQWNACALPIESRRRKGAIPVQLHPMATAATQPISCFPSHEQLLSERAEHQHESKRLANARPALPQSMALTALQIESCSVGPSHPLPPSSPPSPPREEFLTKRMTHPLESKRLARERRAKLSPPQPQPMAASVLSSSGRARVQILTARGSSRLCPQTSRSGKEVTDSAAREHTRGAKEWKPAAVRMAYATGYTTGAYATWASSPEVLSTARRTGSVPRRM